MAHASSTKQLVHGASLAEEQAADQQQQDASMETQVPALTHDILVQILQWLPQQKRLGACSVVSQAFRAAAVAASTSIQLHTCSNSKADSLIAWLGSYGDVPTHLDLQLNPHTLMELPACARLRRLQVTSTGVQLCPVDSTPSSSEAGSSSLPCTQLGVLQGCPGLTCLSMIACTLLDTSEQLAGLSVVTDLQELHLRHASALLPGDHFAHVLPPGTLSRLTRVSCLCLDPPVALVSLDELACLTGLLSLRVALSADDDSASVQAGLSALLGLTSLSLQCPGTSNVEITRVHTPCIGKMTNMRHLNIESCRVLDTYLLQGMTQLESLCLCSLTFTQHASVCSLLAVLPALKSLADLLVIALRGQDALDVAHFSTLAGLHNVMLGCSLPLGLWQHLHQAGITFPDLQNLILAGCRPGLLDVDGVRCMLACCPSLVDLVLWDAVVPGSLDDERFWRGFEGIRKLHLNGVADVHIPFIIRYLPKLQVLGVFERSAVTAPAVVSLTALTALSELQIYELPIAGSDAATVIMLRTPQGPPVWEQLLMFGLRHSDSRPVLQQQVQRLQEDLQRPPYAATLSRNAQLPAELRELEAEAWMRDVFV